MRVFEIGHVYAHPDDPQPLPAEREELGVALGGAESPAAVEVWTVIADLLGITDDHLIADEISGLHPTRSARIVVGGDARGDGGTTVGAVGEIDPDVLASFDVPERVAWLEVDLDALLALPHGEKPYRPVSRFPSSDVDLAFEVPDAVPAAEVERVLRSAGGDMLVSLRLFDVYRGAGLPDASRSLAYSLRFQAPDRTLTDEDLAGLRRACIEAVEAALPAKLRT